MKSNKAIRRAISRALFVAGATALVPAGTAIAQDDVDALEEIVVQAEGAIYPAKDAHMGAANFMKFYPQVEEFLKFKDPRISSSFWRRVMGKTQ